MAAEESSKKAGWRLPADLRASFAVALGVGFAGIVIGLLFSAVSFTVLSTLSTLGLPVASMVLYAARGWRAGRAVSESHQFADSCYYLGFLFTLLALIASLAEFAGVSDTTAQINLNTFFTRFGLALVTTVLGLGLRVFLSNFRVDTDESVRDAEEALGEASQKLRHQVDQITVDVRAQAREMQATMETLLEQTKRTVQESNETTKAAVAQSAADFSAATGAASDALKGTASALSENLANSGQELQAANRDTIAEGRRVIGEALAETAGGIRRANSQSLSSIEQAGRNLNNAVSEVVGVISASAVTVARAIESAGNAVLAVQRESERTLSSLQTVLAALSRESDSAASSLDSVKRSLNSISGSEAQLEDLKGALARITALWSEHGRKVEAWGNTLQGINASAAADQKAIASTKRLVEKQLEESREAVHEMLSHFSSFAKYVREELGTD